MVDADDIASDRLFAIGPVTSGIFWEITAVPDIRIPAARLADDLVSIRRRRPRSSA